MSEGGRRKTILNGSNFKKKKISLKKKSNNKSLKKISKNKSMKRKSSIKINCSKKSKKQCRKSIKSCKYKHKSRKCANRSKKRVCDGRLSKKKCEDKSYCKYENNKCTKIKLFKKWKPKILSITNMKSKLSDSDNNIILETNNTYKLK